MMTPDEKGTLPLRTEKLFYDLQDRIYADIVRRIKKLVKLPARQIIR